MARLRSEEVIVKSEGLNPSMAPEERERRIAEAAYYRALARGFQGGDAVDDWLQAEQEITGS